MKSGYIIVAVLLISTALAGCSEPPSPPVSEIPKIVIDNEHNPEDNNSTIIFVHGMDEIRYNNISIYINKTRVMFREDTFCTEYKTNLTHFNLTIDICLDEKKYNYNASYKMSPKVDIVYKITYLDGDTKKIKQGQLPYVERANMMEESDNA